MSLDIVPNLNDFVELAEKNNYYFKVGAKNSLFARSCCPEAKKEKSPLSDVFNALSKKVNQEPVSVETLVKLQSAAKSQLDTAKEKLEARSTNVFKKVWNNLKLKIAENSFNNLVSAIETKKSKIPEGMSKKETKSVKWLHSIQIHPKLEQKAQQLAKIDHISDNQKIDFLEEQLNVIKAERDALPESEALLLTKPEDEKNAKREAELDEMESNARKMLEELGVKK